jgi:hypothetical protein
MAIIMSLILATLCVIRKVHLPAPQLKHTFTTFFSQRLEDERFRKIDFKRGGGGFV